MIKDIFGYINELDPAFKRFTKGSFWAIVGTIISSGLTLLLSIICSRFLGESGYGELGILNSTVSTFGVIAGLGLGAATTKYIAEFREQDKQATENIISLTRFINVVVCLIISIIFYFLSKIIAFEVISAPHLVEEVRISCGVLFFNSINGVQISVLAGFENFRTISKVNIIRGVLNLLLVGILAIFFGVLGSIIGTLFSAFCVTLYCYYQLRKFYELKGISISIFGGQKYYKSVLSFSIPSFLSGVLVVPVTWLGNTMLVSQPNGYSEMGIFNAANQWRLLLLFIPNIINQVAFPILSNLYNDNGQSKYLQALISLIGFSIIIVFIFGLPIVIFQRFIMSLFGASFISGSKVLVLLVFTAIINSYANMVGIGISSSGKMWIGLLINSIWAISFLLLLYFLNVNNAYDLAKSYLFSYLIHSFSVTIFLIINFWHSNRLTRIFSSTFRTQK